MKYYIIAGEPSGDLHGGNLMKGIVAEDSEAQFRFWGGDKMAEVSRVGNSRILGLLPRDREGIQRHDGEPQAALQKDMVCGRCMVMDGICSL